MKKVMLPILLLSSVLCFSCKDDEDPATVCGVTDPIEDMAWLNEMKVEEESDSRSVYSYIAQATFEGETVFYRGSCDPLANWALLLYDCGGNQIEEEYSFNDLENTLIVWKPEDSACAFTSEGDW